MTVLNYAEVTPTLCRSGQPAGDEEWRWLLSLGIRHVIVLNGSQDEGWLRNGGASLTSFTITDVDAQSVLPKPGILDDIDRCVDGMTEKTLVHCTEGKDRTGIVIARYRVRRQGWTKAQAYDEWVRMGSHRYVGLEKAWEEWQP